MFKFLVPFSIIVSVFWVSGCDHVDVNEPDEIIISQVGNKSISKAEFIRRAEYTIRPKYARENYNVQKKIILNSLIAEKLFALEAEGADYRELREDDFLQAYLRGRQEQSMRQWLYAKDIYDHVPDDTVKIKNTFKNAGRKYKIAYVSFESPDQANLAAGKIFDEGVSFNDLFNEDGSLTDVPQREVEWNWNEHEAIIESMFTQPLKKDQVVGPVYIDATHQILIKVLGWTDTPALTDEQILNRWDDVRDRFRSFGAVKAYKTYIQEMMKGKELRFYPDTFYQLADALGPHYLQTPRQKEDAMRDSYWGLNNGVTHETFDNDIEALDPYPLFKLNDEVWTVGRLREEVKSHPLVFRKQKMKNKEFGEQLQLAIIDLVRDKHLTAQAYERGYDKINVVQRNRRMWQDNFYALYHRTRLLDAKNAVNDSSFAENYLPLVEKYLNPYVQSLLEKYSDQVEINVDAFNSIKLLRTDLVALQSDAPYPIMVPGFPVLTTKHELDYGKKMEKR